MNIAEPACNDAAVRYRAPRAGLPLLAALPPAENGGLQGGLGIYVTGSAAVFRSARLRLHPTPLKESAP